MTADLTSWLLEQIGADYAKASRQVIRSDSGSPVVYSGNLTDEDGEHGGGLITWPDEGTTMVASYRQFSELVEANYPQMIHTADPHQVAVCDAHRQIVELHFNGTGFCVGCWEAGGEDGAPPFPCPTLRVLVPVYQDRPGFDPGWLE